MTCYEPVQFSSRRKSRVLRITLESPFTDGNHGASRTERYDVAAWSQLKHRISKKTAPIIIIPSFFFPMCTKFILTENLWAGRLLIGAENSHLWFTNVLKIRDTECLRSGLVSSPTITQGTIPDGML